MVGGKVIGIVRKPGETMLHVHDTRSTDVCCIDVEERRRSDGSPVAVGLGDSVWWQGRDALWTAASRIPHDPGVGCGRDWDIALPRIGYSYNMGHLPPELMNSED